MLTQCVRTGHQQPQYQPRAALEHLFWMLELDGSA